jgi:hypothetical protein
VPKPSATTTSDLLPIECLLCIFEELCILEPHTGPTRVSSVCRQWRDAATQAPSLWAKLLFWIPIGNADFPLQQRWLSRSSASDISVTIKSSYNSSLAGTERSLETRRVRDHIASILEVLKQHSSRWKSFEYLQCPWSGLSALVDALEGNPHLVNLETLRVQLRSPPPNYSVSPSGRPYRCDAWKSLRSLEIWNARLDPISLQLLSNLRSLHVFVTAFTAPLHDWATSLHSTLQALPLLQTLTIPGHRTDIPPYDRAPKLPSLVLEELVFLSIEDNELRQWTVSCVHLPRIRSFNGSILGSLLPGIARGDTAPALQALQISGAHGRGHEPILVHHNMYASFSEDVTYFVHLTSITISWFFIRPGDLDGLGSSCPGLRNLVLTRCTIEGDVIKLMINARAATFHEKLDFLGFHVCIGLEHNDREWLRGNVKTLDIGNGC